jgi:pyocin large subunit-like protein
MNLDVHEFIRRFLIHVFPKRFHHIRHDGLLANGNRADNVVLARRLLATQNHDPQPDVSAGKAADEPKTTEPACPACSDGPLSLIEIFEPGAEPAPHHQRAPPKQRIQPS